MILSNLTNPYFYSGKYSGIGGSHTGDRMAWPLSLIVIAFTSSDDAEIMECLETLKSTTANTSIYNNILSKDFMHESFNVDNPNTFTRKWFAWANTMFG